MQLFVEHDPRQNYYTLDEACADQLRTVACFDMVANNTDRKAGHLLLDDNGKIWGIDQALTFHADTKIRTVIWDFGGEPIPERLLKSLRNLCEELGHAQGRLQEFLDLLLPEEVAALHRRLEWVLTEGAYPGLPGRKRRG